MCFNPFGFCFVLFFNFVIMLFLHVFNTPFCTFSYFTYSYFLVFVGGAVASWLVRLSPDRAVWV